MLALGLTGVAVIPSTTWLPKHPPIFLRTQPARTTGSKTIWRQTKKKLFAYSSLRQFFVEWTSYMTVS